MRPAALLGLVVVALVVFGFRWSNAQQDSTQTTRPTSTEAAQDPALESEFSEARRLDLRKRKLAAQDRALDSTVSNLRVTAHAMAGYPQIGAAVEVGLAQNAQFSVPAPFSNPTASTKVTSFRGLLIAFDASWVGLESTETGSKMWVPRENVAYVIAEKSSAPRIE